MRKCFAVLGVIVAVSCGTQGVAQQSLGDADDVNRVCVTNALAKAPQSDLVLGIPIGTGGEPKSVPQVEAPQELGAAARFDYLIVAAALERCVPLIGLADNSTLTLTVLQNGTLLFDGVPAATAPTLAPLALPPLALGQAPTVAPPPSEGTEESEAALALDKQAIRDLQARLSVLGIDPNGIDGAIGRGTRTAIRNWQASQGLNPTGYLDAGQMARLRQQSQPGLDTWLQVPENKLLHTPPPPISVGAHNMPGNWRFTANCGSRSRSPGVKVTGVLNIAHNGGGRYSGTLRNSQGLNGRVTAQLSGRTVTSTTNYGLLFGKVDFRGRIDDQQLVIRGRDSNGCSVYARKS